MVADEDLGPSLNGERGVVHLDIARELLGLRKEVEMLRGATAAMQLRAEHAEGLYACAQSDCDGAKARLASLCEALASMSAELREALSLGSAGNAEQE